MKFSILFFVSFFSIQSFGQFDVTAREQELCVLLDSVRASKTNDQKEFWNVQFKALLDNTLHEPTVFDLSFPKLRTLGVIDSPDNMVRIINWNVEQEDASQKYYAYVIHRESKTGKTKIFELIDNSMMLPGKPEETLASNMWYGALYYQIIPVEKGNKLYYTVLGWDGGTRMSNTKLIDVLYFTGSTLKLGYPLFKIGENTVKRVFFEHSERSVMSLKYEPEYKRIIFDHLSPETPTMEGFHEFYVPDMSYDALVLENNRWLLVEDVIGINKKQHIVSLSQINEKSGEVSSSSIDSKWEDPTGTGSSGSSDEVHVAVLPDANSTNTTNKNQKTVKKDENNPLNISTYKQDKKRKKEKRSSLTGDLSKTKKSKK
ncbi:hypothetical protein [Fluviicola taffensis]|uniref:Uncharacterized protein n=1 Tax=Fluviicola taffensis (strain DSM 16823 / NCIMB 13979 / RW262) TaxID=755732 RepID=F2IDC4_FLUTR|nr:hypothetical protein [Fluviicola taffensis]AEA45539.1 hypothetical protein Fluta_3570 [Fluviicola taffensis DSM 16823]